MKINFTKKVIFTLLLFLNIAYADSEYTLVNSIPPLTVANALNDILISDNGEFMVLIPGDDTDAYVYKDGKVVPLDIPGGVDSNVKSAILFSGSKKLLVQTDKAFYIGMFKQGWQEIPFPSIPKNALITGIAASNEQVLTILVGTSDGRAYLYRNNMWQQLQLPEFSSSDFLGATMSTDGSVMLINGFKTAALYKDRQWKELRDPALPKEMSITNVAMSNNGNIIIISTDSQGNYIYENNQWKPLNVNGKNNQGSLTSLIMTNDATEIVAAIQYDAFYLYKNGGWSKIEQTINPNIEFSSAVMSEDGNKILVACPDMGAFIYQMGKWGKITIKGTMDGDANSVRVSAEGNVFAIAGGTYTAFNIDGRWKYLLGPQD